MIGEVLDDLADDARTVERILQIGGDRRAAAEQQAVVGGQPEVGVHELRIPALHLLAGREENSQLLVRERLGHAQEGLRVKHFVRERADRLIQLVDRNDDLVGRDAAAMRVHGVILEPLHLGALVDLHAIVDQQVLETLQAGQRIDAVGAAVANTGACIPARPECP